MAKRPPDSEYDRQTWETLTHPQQAVLAALVPDGSPAFIDDFWMGRSPVRTLRALAKQDLAREDWTAGLDNLSRPRYAATTQGLAAVAPYPRRRAERDRTFLAEMRQRRGEVAHGPRRT